MVYKQSLDSELKTASGADNSDVLVCFLSVTDHLPPDGRGPLINGAVTIHKKLEEAQRDRAKLGAYLVICE